MHWLQFSSFKSLCAFIHCNHWAKLRVIVGLNVCPFWCFHECSLMIVVFWKLLVYSVFHVGISSTFTEMPKVTISSDNHTSSPFTVACMRVLHVALTRAVAVWMHLTPIDCYVPIATIIIKYGVVCVVNFYLLCLGDIRCNVAFLVTLLLHCFR